MRLDINSLVTTNVLKINYMHNFFYSQNTNTLIPPTGIDYITKENHVLTVNQGFSIHIPQKLRYIKLRVAYHLESDDMLIEKVEPIKNYIITRWRN